jgi:muramidase (phage lysozyme)
MKCGKFGEGFQIGRGYQFDLFFHFRKVWASLVFSNKNMSEKELKEALGKLLSHWLDVSEILKQENNVDFKL